LHIYASGFSGDGELGCWRVRVSTAEAEIRKDIDQPGKGETQQPHRLSKRISLKSKK
jgi:hypothetical protein